MRFPEKFPFPCFFLLSPLAAPSLRGHSFLRVQRTLALGTRYTTHVLRWSRPPTLRLHPVHYEPHHYPPPSHLGHLLSHPPSELRNFRKILYVKLSFSSPSLPKEIRSCYTHPRISPAIRKHPQKRRVRVSFVFVSTVSTYIRLSRYGYIRTAKRA